jgi:curved DNA-binding protein CbpA
VIGRRTFYQVLMVDQAADADIIGAVHRRLAQRYHPDRDSSPEAQQRMLEINQAWNVLKSEELRARYDAELAQRRDRRAADRYVRRPTDIPAANAAAWTEASPYGEAGPPRRGPARGSVLDFGRYRGWTLGQIALHDRDFLLWLERSPAGRQHRMEIGQILSQTPEAGTSLRQRR